MRISLMKPLTRWRGEFTWLGGEEGAIPVATASDSF